MYVVAGVSGNTGSVVADSLLAAKKQVRVLVRDEAKGAAWKAKGAEVSVTTLEDEAGLTAALKGAEGAYLLAPPLFADDYIPARIALVDTIGRAVKASGVANVTFLSSIGAEHASGTGPIGIAFHAEKVLGAIAGLNATFLRASYFAENWQSVAGAAKEQGVLPSFLDLDAKLPMVATVDIGKRAARSLAEPSKGTRVITLGGPVDLSPNEVAAVFAKVLGRNVNAIRVPDDHVVPTLTGMHVPPKFAAAMAEMMVAANHGKLQVEAGRTLERGTTAIEEVIRKWL